MPTNPHDIITDHPADYPGFALEADGFGFVVKDRNGIVHQSARTQFTSDPLTNLQRAKIWLKDNK